MNIYVNQTISIQTIRINGISNSSVLQIGTSGVLKPTSYAANTGEFIGPAPEVTSPYGGVVTELPQYSGPLVPLTTTS